MHELSIVREMMETLVQSALSEKASRISKVKLKMNPLSGFDADDVEFSFELVKKENPLTRDAVLNLEVLRGLVRCKNCGEEFEVEELPNICSKCESLELVPLEPMGLFLITYELEK